MSDNSPFFIVGAGRSGTTLLRLILAGHSRLHIPPETWFIEDLVRELPLRGPLTREQVARAVELMTGHYRWADMEIAAGDLKAWAEELNDPRLVDVINLVYRRHLENNSKIRFGDKTPSYFAILPKLAEIYDGAKFIHVIRDGRDVAISFIDATWERYYDKRSFPWTTVMKRRREYLRTPLADQILEVRYEDLMRDPENTIRSICQFLGEEFEPAMMEWRHRIDHLVPQRERHHHSKLTRPISADTVGAWQQKLSAWECFAMESCLYRDLQTLGYRLRFSGIAWRPLLAGLGTILTVSAPLLNRGVPYLQRRQLLPREIYL